MGHFLSWGGAHSLRQIFAMDRSMYHLTALVYKILNSVTCFRRTQKDQAKQHEQSGFIAALRHWRRAYRGASPRKIINVIQK
jgi:hypothetical protein